MPVTTMDPKNSDDIPQNDSDLDIETPITSPIENEDDVEVLDPEPVLQQEMNVPSQQREPEENDELIEQVVQFPKDQLEQLNDMINKPRWIVPVLPRAELEVLLITCIQLAKQDRDDEFEECELFFKDGLTISFSKILTDDAVNGWKPEIQKFIHGNCKLLIDLCYYKLKDDHLPLLDLLAMAFNPNCKFHAFNKQKPTDPAIAFPENGVEEQFARPPEARGRCPPTCWLVDLLNRFGRRGGFAAIRDRFTDAPQNGKPLTFALISALTRPFGQCHDFLIPETIRTYFIPITTIVQRFLESLSDEDLKKESKSEVKNDALSAIMKSLKNLVAQVPGYEDQIRELELFRLRMILRLLRISSFNGKMNALNEVNKVIVSVSYHYQRHGSVAPLEEEEWLTAEKMAEWIQQNEVLDIVLRDSLHQPQYVEKLEKILRFMVKEKALTSKDLDRIWDAQHGKHDAIVKNIHELLAKLAWDFTPVQLDHLFKCFQDSWTTANKQQREKLLELIRRLAEDDKEGVMAQKVLGLLWNLAHKDDCPTDIMDQALSALIKILDYSCSHERDQHKLVWIEKFVKELETNERWVLPALKQIMEVCKLFNEQPNTYSSQPSVGRGGVTYRCDVINRLQTDHSIVMIVAKNLVQYIDKARIELRKNPDLQPEDYLADGRFNHLQQVEERLAFLRFLLRDGQLWLCSPQAVQVWECLAINAVWACDRDLCFKWFTKLMGDEPDLDPEVTPEFYKHMILQLDPMLLTEDGMYCFERFFRTLNSKDAKLLVRKKRLIMNDMNLEGMDYLWRVLLNSTDHVCAQAIDLMKELHANLGHNLQIQQLKIHEDFIGDCFERLRPSFDTLKVLPSTLESEQSRQRECRKMNRVLKLLHEFISECDEMYTDERVILPLSCAVRGNPMSLVIRVPNNQGRQDDISIHTHTNDTLAGVKRKLMANMNEVNGNFKIELYINQELIDPMADKRLVCQIPLKDKMVLNAKLVPISSSGVSGSESSSEGSHPESPGPEFMTSPNPEAEKCLPGVLLASNVEYIPFLHQICDYASRFTPQLEELQMSVKYLLQIVPAHFKTIKDIKEVCRLQSTHTGSQNSYTGPRLESKLFGTSSVPHPISPSQACYILEVLYSLLVPASGYKPENPYPENMPAFDIKSCILIAEFIQAGGISLVLRAITDEDFMAGAHKETKRDGLLLVLKVAKLVLLVTAQSIIMNVYNRLQRNINIPEEEHRYAVTVQNVMNMMPCLTADPMLKIIRDQVVSQLNGQMLTTRPNDAAILGLRRICWSAAAGDLDKMMNTKVTADELKMSIDKMSADIETDEENTNVQLACAALEALTCCMVLQPEKMEDFRQDRSWQTFVADAVLNCRNRMIRLTAKDQFLVLTQHHTSIRNWLSTLLFTLEVNGVQEKASQSHQYFNLLCNILSIGQREMGIQYKESHRLKAEIKWLSEAKDNVLNGEDGVNEVLLEGHLNITKELVYGLSPELKYHYGSHPEGPELIKSLLEVFIMPASRILQQKREGTLEDVAHVNTLPVCPTPQTVTAAYDVIVSLCHQCNENLKLVSRMITDMFYYSNEVCLTDWEYLPPVGSRPQHGFVGLKNGGATCYMNSVLQQLFMMREVRNGILAVEGAANDIDEAEAQNTLDLSTSSPPMYNQLPTPEQQSTSDVIKTDLSPSLLSDSSEKAYHLGVLKHVQVIFAHLARSKLQFYIPRGFWKHFKIQGEQVNVREQHDALEFFERLVESCDEAMESLSQPKLCQRVLCGSYADQKICKDCPHRYSHVQEFTALHLEIRNHSNLHESLEQSVKGDLLEGANAYMCERCGKKVDTVKRMCVKKLPKMLAIQLKRFDYDYERECPIKFNDYFEFPRELDMEPYTEYGLAKREGDAELLEDESKQYANQGTHYKLSGIVVHSGQASGGHYYSYIRHTENPDRQPRWYKYDDGDVSECNMDDDEELKKECFGGEYTGEVFDHMLKRTSFKRQKRWWNGYILIYEKDTEPETQELSTRDRSPNTSNLSADLSQLSLASQSSVRVPANIERIVRQQNLEFMHNRNQFCTEYFNFMRRLFHINIQSLNQTHIKPEYAHALEDLALTTVSLTARFLFSVALHTKKTLRGSASEWYENLTFFFKLFRNVRLWFVEKVLFAHPERFSEYLLECPNQEVRIAISKTIALLAHLCLEEPASAPKPYMTLYSELGLAADQLNVSDHLLLSVLTLLKREVSEHGRNIVQYFNLFVMYCNLGARERAQLLKLKVMPLFAQVALDEGPGPSIKYQCPDLGKLYTVVSMLVRCCDLTSHCQSKDSEKIPTNPNAQADHEPLLNIPEVNEVLFKNKAFIKKIVEDNVQAEDTKLLVLYMCWENRKFSMDVIEELLWQITYCFTYEMSPYTHLLHAILLLKDSWQETRLIKAFIGFSDVDKDGLFYVIASSKNHYQKRAYQCLKLLVNVFKDSEVAREILDTEPLITERYHQAVRWLNDELDRRPYGGSGQFASYNSSWSTPQSNESTNGYFLERTASARLTLRKALEILPEETPEANIIDPTEETSPPSPNSVGPDQPPSADMTVDDMAPSSQSPSDYSSPDNHESTEPDDHNEQKNK